MATKIEENILALTGALNISDHQPIQSLWSGYGEIYRLQLKGWIYDSVVVKHIKLPKPAQHKRGFNSDIAHQRKLSSYQVELNWYQHFAERCNDVCKIPKCIAVDDKNDEILLILEDLNSTGFGVVKDKADHKAIKTCLIWLANFHGNFLNFSDPEQKLWSIGSYWHLATRPDEYHSMQEGQLKSHAHDIDEVLNNCKYQTLIHGDAKLANFCFSESGEGVAAVDFQYIGRGCGIKDVVYFIGSCLQGEACEQFEEELLAIYFSALKKALPDMTEFSELEAEWRTMFMFAWADFERFLQGWNPGHWKLSDYSEKMTANAINLIKTNKGH